MTIVADMEDFAETEPQSAAMFEQMFGDEGIEMKFYGELDGSATAMSIGDNDLMRVFGDDEAYLSRLMPSSTCLKARIWGSPPKKRKSSTRSPKNSRAPGWTTAVSFRRGSEEDSFDVGSLFTQLQDSLWEDGEASESSPIERDQISDEGTHEVRGDTDIWVSPEVKEAQELVLEANHEPPKFLKSPTMRSRWLSPHGEKLKHHSARRKVSDNHPGRHGTANGGIHDGR